MARRGGIRRAEYKALLTEAYDLDKPEAPGEALAYYMRHIRACGEPVLEAMCGSGRFLAPLLEAGIDVDGVDASADMLAACAARCEERRIRARTYRQFLHELGLPRRYRLIFAGGASLGLIVDESEVTETSACFTSIDFREGPSSSKSRRRDTSNKRPSVRTCRCRRCD